jgi:hypothetical protein
MLLKKSAYLTKYQLLLHHSVQGRSKLDPQYRLGGCTATPRSLRSSFISESEECWNICVHLCNRRNCSFSFGPRCRSERNYFSTYQSTFSFQVVALIRYWSMGNLGLSWSHQIHYRSASLRKYRFGFFLLGCPSFCVVYLSIYFYNYLIYLRDWIKVLYNKYQSFRSVPI